MIRKTVSVVGCLLLTIGLMGFAPDPGRAAEGSAAAAPPVGETDLFNFEHVANFNFSFVLNGGSEGQQGTDIEFFTADVAETVLEDGTVVPAGTRDFAVVGDHSNGIVLIDITDPEDAFVASFIACDNPRSDIGVFQHEVDGELRTYVGSSRESGGICEEAGPATTTTSESDTGLLVSDAGGFAMFDTTNPYDPQPFASVLVGNGGAHNFIFHPTEPVAYAWNGEISSEEYTLSNIQIVDMRPYFTDGGDVTEIVSFIGPETLASPHDGELSPDGSVMYVASGTNYEIFDNSDPYNPVATTSFAPNPGTYAHGYFPTPDGNIAVTNNESLALGGFFVGGTSICPGEGLAFYDTSTEGAAVGPLGVYAPPVHGRGPDSRACTSHFGRVAPNNQVMAVGWYVLGGRVVDFADPTLPIEIGAATFSVEDSQSGPYAVSGGNTTGTEAWSAKFYKGPYMYVGDQGRGFDIFKWTGPEECGNPFDETYDSACMVESGQYRLVVDPAAERTDSFLSGITIDQALAVLGEEQQTQFRYSCQLQPA